MEAQKKISSILDLMEMADKQVHKIIEDQQEEAMNIFIAQSTDDQLSIIAAPWSSNSEKAMVLVRLRLLFATAKVCRYVNVCEAWVSRDMELHKAGIQPRDDPQREEVVHICGVEHGKVLFWHYPIIEVNGRRKLGEKIDRLKEGAQIGGTITELLGTRAAH